MMKRVNLILALCSLATITFAQDKFGNTPEEQQKCKENISLYREYRDQKLYDDAFGPWKEACKICPKSAKTLYTDGEKFLGDKIEKATDDAIKDQLINELMAMYDARIENFGQEAYVLGKKGMDLLKYKPTKAFEASKLMKLSIDGLKSKTSPGVISAYYNALFIAASQDSVSKETLLEEYLTVSDYLAEGRKTANEKYITFYDQVKDMLDANFVKIASCDDIIPIAQKQFAANGDDVETLKKLSKILQKRDCSDAPIYEKIAVKLNEKEPSAEAAYGLAVYYAKKGSYGSAFNYAKKAVDMLPAGSTDELDYLLFASGVAIGSGQAASGASYARKAIAVDKNSGRAYLSLGQAIAAANCGDNELIKKAVYWLAVDYFQKAKSVDSSVASEAGKLINAYTARFPDRKLLFQYGYIDASNNIKTEPVQIGCWVNESVRPRE